MHNFARIQSVDRLIDKAVQQDSPYIATGKLR